MKKEEVFKQNKKKILSLIHKYKNVIHDYEVEDLYQEVLTHLDVKLNDYDESKASIDTFVYMVTKNKLYNMANNKHNYTDTLVGEGTMERLVEERREDYTLADKEALEIAFDLIGKHEHKAALFDLIKGETQQHVAKKYGYSQQNLSKVWKKLIEQIQHELR